MSMMRNLCTTVGRYSVASYLSSASELVLMDSLPDEQVVEVTGAGKCSMADLRAWLRHRDAQVTEATGSGTVSGAELPNVRVTQ